MSKTLASTLDLPLPDAAAQPMSGHVVDDDALRPGTRLDEFELIRVLGTGGFGIAYLALDHVLQRQVAIKEYMPTSLARRGASMAVAIRSAEHAETFARGLDSFFNEARLLAGFDHPSLVKVHRFWKANGTAYMAMQYYPGVTLKQARRAMPATPDGAWLRAFVDAMLEVLELLHRDGVYHRDVAPDNILLLPDGRPVLLDFGAARRVIGDDTQTLTAVLKPSFAPIEQYADVAGMRQGPWTDLYALGATVHFVLTGRTPTPAVMRVVQDAMPALSTPGAPAFAGVPKAFLASIDWTLALAPADRPQSVASLRRAFNQQFVPPPPSRRFSADSPPNAIDTDAITVVATRPASAGEPLRRWQAMEGSSTLTPARGPAPRGVLWTMGLVAVAVGTLGWSMLGTEASDRVPLLAAPVAAIPLATSAAASASITDPVAASAVKAPAAVRVPVATPRKAVAHASALGPNAACADLNFFSRAICLSRECKTPRWRDHPQCVELRAIEERGRQHAEH